MAACPCGPGRKLRGPRAARFGLYYIGRADSAREFHIVQASAGCRSAVRARVATTANRGRFYATLYDAARYRTSLRLTHPVSACVQSLRARIAHAPSSSPTATAPSVPNPARGGGGGRRAPHRRSSPHRSDSFLLSSSPHRVSEIGRDLHAFCSPSDGDDVLFSSAPFLQRAGSSSLLAHNFLQTKTSTRSVAQAAVVRPWRALTLPARCSATACSS